MKSLEEISEMLENGVREVFESNRYREYIDMMAKFYDYSANNCLLIMMQCPTATLVAGYRKWQDDFSRNVKKGEKAIRIIAPIPHKKKKESVTADGNVEEREVQWTSFRAVPVFDLSQTEGKELPTITKKLTGEVNGYDEIIDRLTAFSPVPVNYEEIVGSANGYYSGAENRIVVQRDMAQAQTIKTLVHEIAHAMLHGEGCKMQDADRSTREVQAESVAYIVCKQLGINSDDYSFGYVAGWSKDKDMQALMESMEVIRTTAKAITDRMVKSNSFYC